MLLDLASIFWPRLEAGGKGGGGAYSLIACLSQLTVDLASLSRRRIIPTAARDTSARDTSTISALLTLCPYSVLIVFADFIIFLFCRREAGRGSGCPRDWSATASRCIVELTLW